jgi:transcription antitermination factor NusG
MAWGCANTYVMLEMKAVEHLERQGFTAFCPLHARPNPKKLTELKKTPLFPGYVFVRLIAGEPWSAINSTHGVIRLMTDQMRRHVRWKSNTDPRPLYVSDDIIDPLFEVRIDGLKPNTLVRIKNRNNSFYDMTGKIDLMSGSERVMVLMSMFNRDMVVEFRPTELEIVEV